MIELIRKYLKIIITIITLLLIGTISIIYFILNKKDIEEPVIELEEQIEIQKEPIEEEIKKIKIDIKGEVINPGVYELKENDRVSDAINISGGLTENADTELINLSKSLKDEMVIIIYNKYEIEKIRQQSEKQETVIKYIEKKCNCPDTINDACINKQEKDTKETKKDEKISINTASLEELMQVDGIGESKAKAIIKYREENGNFETIEDIKKVSGIGDSTFEKFKENITI